MKFVKEPKNPEITPYSGCVCHNESTYKDIRGWFSYHFKCNCGCKNEDNRNANRSTARKS